MDDIISTDIGKTVQQAIVAITKLDPPKTTRNNKIFTTAQISYQNNQKEIHTFQARIWDYDQAQKLGLKPHTVIQTNINIEEYQNKKQYSIEGSDIKVLPNENYNQYIPHSYWSEQYLEDGIADFIKHIHNPHYQQLVINCIAQIQTDLKQEGIKLSEMPAAIKMHHAFISGLYTHTLSMLKIAQGVLNNTIYKNYFDSSLIYTGIILHDLGKAYCYTNAYDHVESKLGKMFDHIVIMDGIICDQAKKVYHQTYSQLLHNDEFIKLRQVLIAHHEKLEWGAPKTPVIPEGWFVHMVDTFDAHMETVREQIDNHDTGDDGFTGKVFNLENSPLYLGKNQADNQNSNQTQ